MHQMVCVQYVEGVNMRILYNHIKENSRNDHQNVMGRRIVLSLRLLNFIMKQNSVSVLSTPVCLYVCDVLVHDDLMCINVGVSPITNDAIIT